MDRLLPYWVAQLLGGIAAALVLYLIASGKDSSDVVASGFAANGYREHSPGRYPLGSAFLAEFVLTFFFLLIILGTTHGRTSTAAGFAGLAIGLGLALIHNIDLQLLVEEER